MGVSASKSLLLFFHNSRPKVILFQSLLGGRWEWVGRVWRRVEETIAFAVVAAACPASSFDRMPVRFPSDSCPVRAQVPTIDGAVRVRRLRFVRVWSGGRGFVKLPE